ncbi:MAG: hypothetical protein ACNA7Y_06540, partial [Gammaproteobacteria bacterium]
MISYRKLSIVFTFILFCCGLVACVATPPQYKQSQQKVADAQRDVNNGSARFGQKVQGHSVLSAQSITLDRKGVQPAWMHRQISIQGNGLPLD